MARKKKGSSGGGWLLAIVGAVLVILVAVGGYFGLDLEDLAGTGGQTGPVIVPPLYTPVPGRAGPWYEIYFTDPTCPPENERVGGVDEVIAADIHEAQVRVDIASFDLDSAPIINALIERKANGVEVRVVVDDENTPEATVNKLRRNGISVVGDGRGALMHNKFIVIDGRYVWTGSMNFTSNGAYCNNNNIARLDAPQLAANYTAELEEMYVDRLFGPRSPENTVNRLTINGVEVENYFAAEDELAPIIARVVARADSEILFLAFSFTSQDIGEAMLERAEGGLAVRGVFERTGSDSRFSYWHELSGPGLQNVSLRVDGNPRIMHHKVIIIDREIVVFGSYNFTGSANDSNDENLLIVHDPEFTRYFVEEFEAVWQEGKANP